MNPSIHHPRWYEMTKIFEEAEVSEAEKGTLICSPAISRFSTGRFNITCQVERWDVEATDPSLFSKGIEIASKTFEKLEHTPITAYGLNFAYHRGTAVSDVARFLASRLEGARLGFARLETETSSATIVYRRSKDEHVMTVTVEASLRDARSVFVSINCHHPIREKGYFDLSRYLRESASLDQPAAEAQLSAILKGIQA